MASVATLAPTNILDFSTNRASKDLVLPKTKPAPECPLFLRKTYHMVDTCDRSIATWSDDGETFVVKDTERFEKEIIPQFFKHSKFASFVRQLNFYGFRKIRYSDTIKIDRQLEAETANFWRFRHEKFRRGREDLLVEIKRSHSQPQQAASSKPAEKPEEVKSLKTEVTVLKERIASMSKNIDELNVLVQNMALKDKKEEEEGASNKRKKMDDMDITMADFLPPANGPSEDIDFTPGTIFPAEPSERQTSASTTLSDEAFVDELFSTFGEKGSLDVSEDDSVLEASRPIITSETGADMNKNNTPDPKLMTKLSEALTLLPKEMQEMLVNRMIATITGTENLRLDADTVTSVSPTNAELPIAVPVCPSPIPVSRESVPQPEIALPLAAATLGALFSHYANAKSKGFVAGPLPVIPAQA